MAKEATRNDIKGHVANRRPFKGSSATGVAGDIQPHQIRQGLMPDDEYQCLIADATTRGVTYIVYSYDTPIAYVVRGIGTIVPDVKYSATTSQYQNICRVYL